MFGTEGSLMFGDILGLNVTIAQFRESMVAQAATNLAFVKILVHKGVCTEEEYFAARAQALSEIDQFHAQRREEELAAMSPKERKSLEFFQRLTGQI